MNVLTKKGVGLRRSEGAEPAERLHEIGYIPTEESPRLFRSLFVDICLDNSGMCIDSLD